MSTSGWIATIALGLAVVAILVFGGLQGIDLHEQYANEREQAAADTDRRIENSLRSCREIPSRFDAIHCQAEAHQTADEERATQRDLKAQQHMSLWAVGILVLSLATFVLTVGGLVFVAGTFSATAGALNAMLSEQRPWLVVDAFGEVREKLEKLRANGNNSIPARFTIRNIGKSPAVDVKVRHKVYAVVYGQSGILPETVLKEPIRRYVENEIKVFEKIRKHVRGRVIFPDDSIDDFNMTYFNPTAEEFDSRDQNIDVIGTHRYFCVCASYALPGGGVGIDFRGYSLDSIDNIRNEIPGLRFIV